MQAHTTPAVTAEARQSMLIASHTSWPWEGDAANFHLVSSSTSLTPQRNDRRKRQIKVASLISASTARSAL